MQVRRSMARIKHVLWEGHLREKEAAQAEYRAEGERRRLARQAE